MRRNSSGEVEENLETFRLIDSIMWYLNSEIESRILYILSPGKDVTVGRSVDKQNCNFAIPDDASISRKHATLSIFDGKLFVEDLGSRYGTFINESGETIQSNAKTVLKSDDIVKFGKLGSVWKVNEISFVTCTSTLKGENLHKLKESLTFLGGTLKGEWDDTCAYLTMPAITLTIKVVLALAQCSYVVTTEFWEKCVVAVNNYEPLPDPSKYIPQILESTLNKEQVSFLPNVKRKSLFAGKKFIFFTKRQLDMYKPVLIKSSANVLLLSESKITKSNLCDEDVIVIQYNLTSNTPETLTQKNNILDIVNYMKTKGKRVVADAEIGLAILYCSRNKYCNPDFNFPSEVLKQPVTGDLKNKNILAKETQESTQGVIKVENVVIDESLTSLDKSCSTKRKFNEENNEVTLNPNKKLAVKMVSLNESGKRKNYDDIESSAKPSKKLAINQDDSEEMFHFTTNPPSEKTDNSTKKLMFSKALKRRNDSGANDEDDDLFNFIPDKKNKENNVSLTRSTENCPPSFTKKSIESSVDVAALRGIKLKELNSGQTSNNYSTETHKIKREINDDLETKLSELDLGTTIIKVRKDLIIKKEPLNVEEPYSTLKNFKKFKKVWPVKMQVTVIPKSFASKSTLEEIKLMT